MKIDIATLFPEMVESVLMESIIGRARTKGSLDIECYNIRDYADNDYGKIDDAPYGGGMGLVMQAPPIYECYKDICENRGSKPFVIYMSPQGRVLDQQFAVELSQMEHIMVLCGHYEGVDERIINEIVDMEVSIGDYVLTGGELGAMVLVDCVGRLCDGVLKNSSCFEEESHYNGLLEYPQYTRPAEYHGMEVPAVLLSGHHKNIEDFRLQKSLERTRDKRPDMFEKYPLSKAEKKLLGEE